jgi:type IV pilus assembly protein PilC
MISVGEETGTLDNILEESAIFYEEDVSQTMNNLPSILEPVLMVILGIGVGGMAVAVIMPMYSLSQQI